MVMDSFLSSHTRRSLRSDDALHPSLRSDDALHPSLRSDDAFRRLLQSDDSSLFLDFRPPARDSFSLPPHVLYVTAGLLLVLLATYAIVGHLIDDLLHDLADWVFGPKADEAESGSEEEEKVEMEDERAGPLPGFSSTEHLQHLYITSL
ncbi:unnamed protein product [Leuciscus chuanchicus]